MTEPIPLPPPVQQHHFKTTNLSYSQESLWFLQQLDPENTAYNSNILLKFTGKIDPHSGEQGAQGKASGTVTLSSYCLWKP